MEDIIRISFFLGLLLVIILWEIVVPRRQLSYTRQRRWLTNISLSILNTLLVRFSLGATAFITATAAFEHGWGLLNIVLLPSYLSVIITIVLLDLAIYGQHVASHHWSWLWRLHKVHHTDLDFDVSTAVRFHPAEIILSMVYKVVCIALLGADPIAVIAFEIILSSSALFNHSNISIPQKVDAVIRLFIVTPDMHRVHHSIIRSETDSNYGSSLSVWDRLFSCYTAQPKAGHINMIIGLAEYQKMDDISLKRLLVLPLKSGRDL